MGARQKLSAAYLNGGLFVATFAGLVAQRRALFWLALIVSVALRRHSGETRRRPDGRKANRAR